jgi:hypothetical protein
MFVKVVPTTADRGCHVIGVTDLYGRILDFLDRLTSELINILFARYSKTSVGRSTLKSEDGRYLFNRKIWTVCELHVVMRQKVVVFSCRVTL